MIDCLTLIDVNILLLAQKGRVSAAGLLILFALFQCFAGVAAIVGGAALWSTERSDIAAVGSRSRALPGNALSSTLRLTSHCEP